MGTQYSASLGQFERLAKHPRISGPFALDKNLWEGKRVAVLFMKRRGSYRRETDMRIEYGTLVLRPNAPERTDQIAVRNTDGTLHVVHQSRVKGIYDLTRTKPEAKS